LFYLIQTECKKIVESRSFVVLNSISENCFQTTKFVFFENTKSGLLKSQNLLVANAEIFEHQNSFLAYLKRREERLHAFTEFIDENPVRCFAVFPSI